jgi:thiamine-monophosphate kinase
MTEDIHFSLKYFEPEDIGRRILAANLSDIASMGGKPRYFTISIAIPPHLKEGDFLSRLTDGIHESADIYNVKLIGGDTCSSKDKLFIDIMMIGSCPSGTALRRSGAKPGDLVYILGKLGRAEGGLRLFQAGWRLADGRAISPDGKMQGTIRELTLLKCMYSHLDPQPMIHEGMILRESSLVNAMIDTSDGLSSDIYHICEESGVGAIINGGAFDTGFFKPLLDSGLDFDPRDLILNGGEDFLLLFTVPAENKNKIEDLLLSKGIHDFSRIGIITDEKLQLKLERTNSKVSEIKPSGWEHK